MSQRAMRLEDDGVGREVDPIAACASRPDRAHFVWAHLGGDAEETSAWLQRHGGLPVPVARALTATETRPRTEAIAEGALVNLRGPVAEADAAGDMLASVRLWLEDGRAISVGFRPLTGFDRLREEMAAGRIKDPGDLVAHLAIIVTKQLDPTIAALGDLVDACEEAIDPDNAYSIRRRIARARSEAIAYRRFVAPQREALLRLAELPVPWLEEDDRLHLREAADRFARMTEELEAVRERAALIHEQLTDIRSERIEGRALVLSVVALIFLPLTFITGLLGMNVEGIPFAREPWAFWGVCAGCATVAVAITAWFAWRRWLED